MNIIGTQVIQGVFSNTLTWTYPVISFLSSNDEIYISCRSSNILRVIKSRSLRWAAMIPEWKKAGVLSIF